MGRFTGRVPAEKGSRIELDVPLARVPDLAEQVRDAYDLMMLRIGRAAPEADLVGVYVEEMCTRGTEVILGMTRDPQFGPMLMFGLGGTLVEILKDVAFRITPLTRQDAKEMIRQVKGYRLLEGYRGQPPLDIEYLEDMLTKLSAFVEENPEIKEMDINPLFIYRKGTVAVDARIILNEDNHWNG